MTERQALVVSAVAAGYGQVTVVTDLTLACARGEFLGWLEATPPAPGDILLCHDTSPWCAGSIDQLVTGWGSGMNFVSPTRWLDRSN